MAIDSYTTLIAAFPNWMEASAAVGTEAPNIVQLAEAGFNRHLGSDYRRITTATVNTDSSGLATLPTGFVFMRSLVRDVLGSLPLTQVSWNALTVLNPYADSDDAGFYAIRGTQLQVAPVTDDDFIATYERTLVALSVSNASNWLLEAAPDAYLFMCLGLAHQFNENWATGGALEQKALSLVDEVVNQSQVAQFGNAEVVLDGPTP